MYIFSEVKRELLRIEYIWPTFNSCIQFLFNTYSYILFCVQNESLNGGGTLFVNKHPNLRVRVVHGNTLTAAVILNELPKDVKEVFLTGATSKLGRAIALYLCRKRVRVLVSSAQLWTFFFFKNIYIINFLCFIPKNKMLPHHSLRVSYQFWQ